MFDTVVASRFSIWIIAAAIVLIDSAVLLEPGKFPYRIRNSKSQSAVVAVPNSAFAIRNKNLVVTLLTFPVSLLLVSDVRIPRLSAADLQKAIAGLRRLQKQFAFFSVSAATALLLVVMGSLLAALHYQTLAILVVAGSLYSMALIVGTFIVLRRRVFNMSKSAAWLQVVELVLCPILIVNIGKKLGCHIQPRINTFQIVNEASQLGAIEENLSFFGISSKGPVE